MLDFYPIYQIRCAFSKMSIKKIEKEVCTMGLVSVQTLKSSEDFILYQLPVGKPDPSQNCVFGEVDKRDRVFQSAQKGNECWFYAAKMISPRAPKNPGSFKNPCHYLEKLRGKEQLCSLRRKETLKADELLKFGNRFFPFVKLDLPAYEKDWDINFEKAQFLITRNEIEDSTKSIFKEFVQQKKSLTVHKFLLERRNDVFLKKIKIFEKFIKSFCESNKINYDISTISLAQTDLEKYGYLYCLVQMFTMKRGYDLRNALWNPTLTIDKLFNEVVEKGPLIVHGYIGQIYYFDDPVEMKDKIGGKSIYYWPKGSKRILDTGQKIKMSHQVVLVGVNKAKSQVYFVDPKDPSDPKKTELQKIYTISYPNLTQNTLDMYPGMGGDKIYSFYSQFVKIIK